MKAREKTPIRALAGLKAAFKQGGSVTAGNSSQMNDAAAGVLVMSRARAEDLGLKPIAKYYGFAVAGVIREAGLDHERVNINGGAIAMGHPLGCTGAKLTTQIIHDLHRLDKQFGMVTMCIGGGMGAAGIFERI